MIENVDKFIVEMTENSLKEYACELWCKMLRIKVVDSVNRGDFDFYYKNLKSQYYFNTGKIPHSSPYLFCKFLRRHFLFAKFFKFLRFNQ